MTGDRITITIHLPQPLDSVGRALDRIAEIWPGTMIDLTHEDGWHIDIKAMAD